MIQMRSIADAFNALKTDDPNTAMTLSGLRRLVNMGHIPSVRIGRRILINYGALIHYLDDPVPNGEQVNENEQGKIRKIQ